MSRRPADVTQAMAARKRGRSRLRVVTAAIGLASLTAGGAVAYGLPGAAHQSSAVTSSAGDNNSSDAASTSRTSNAGTGAASTGLSSAAAPKSSSGSSQVTSGGS
jgi:hypothetical protein